MRQSNTFPCLDIRLGLVSVSLLAVLYCAKTHVQPVVVLDIKYHMQVTVIPRINFVLTAVEKNARALDYKILDTFFKHNGENSSSIDSSSFLFIPRITQTILRNDEMTLPLVDESSLPHLCCITKLFLDSRS